MCKETACQVPHEDELHRHPFRQHVQRDRPLRRGRRKQWPWGHAVRGRMRKGGGVAVAQASSLTSSPGTFNVAASALCIMVKVRDVSPSTTGRHGLKQTLHRLREKGKYMEHERKPRLFRLQSGGRPSSVKPIPDLFQN